MKKKYGIIGMMIVILIVVILLCVFKIGVSKHTTLLKNYDENQVTKIVIHNPAQGITITDKSEMKKVLKLIKNIKGKRIRNNDKEGFAFLIDIYSNKEEHHLSILSEDIMLDGKNYEPDKDYCDAFREIFERNQ